MSDLNRSKGTGFAILLALLLVFFCLGVCVGSVSLSLPELLTSLAERRGESTAAKILWELRLPRVISAVLLGGALSLAGYLLQTFFHNPIAGPFVLGISSGAKLMVALFMVTSLGRATAVSSAALILAAFAGALLSMAFVLLLSRRVNRMSILVIGGVMIGYICTAVTDVVVTFAEDADIVNLHNWSMGSFSGISWENVGVMSVVILVAVLAAFCMAKPMNAYQMGESYAESLGINLKRFRAALVILSSILAACVTAYAGPVSFVGIAVPHLVKSLFRTSKPMVLIPACFLGGSVFCCFCDLLARTAFAPTELSISTVTAIFGAPVVLFILADRRRERG